VLALEAICFATQTFLLALGRSTITLVCEVLAFVSELLALGGDPVALVCYPVALVSEVLAPLQFGLTAVEVLRASVRAVCLQLGIGMYAIT
jgi:hypothetical protein